MYLTLKKQTIKTLLATILPLLLTLTSNSAAASQLLKGDADQTLTGEVSSSDPTMLRVMKHKIRKVFGKQGEFTVSSDPMTGTAYVLATTKEPYLSIYVSDEDGSTWHLLLQVKTGPIEPLAIKGHGESPLVVHKPAQKSDMARNEAIKNTIMELALPGDDLDGVSDEVSDTFQEVPLWQEAKFILTRTVSGEFHGEKYDLTNISKSNMVIDERELYRPRVVAVIVSQPILMPGQHTTVYVISADKEKSGD